MTGTDARRQRVFWLVMATTTALVLTGIVLVGLRLAQPSVAPGDDEAADRRYRQLADAVGGLYDTVPDPTVGRVLQRRVVKDEAGTEVRTNNAGMRSGRDFPPRPERRYRIVLLGDSFTHGYGGPEADRYGDQIAAWLGDHRVDGRRVEVLSLGIPGWTALNEARYLTTRLTAYDPDLIVVLSVNNDIADTQGVRGIGAISAEFSPERRERASGVLDNGWPHRFGVRSVNLLAYDFGPESIERWRRAAGAFARLEALQRDRGGRILFTVLDGNPYFNELLLHFFAEAGIESPVGLVASGTAARPNTLPHDSHPNREGHAMIGRQTLGHLSALGWLSAPGVTVDDSQPRWEPPTGDATAIAAFRAEFADRHLRPRIDFRALEPRDTVQFLGGILPERPRTRALASPPHAAPFAAFLLRRDAAATEFGLTVALPDVPEVFPLTVRMTLDGKASTEHRFGAGDRGREVELVAPLPPVRPGQPALEVRLEADRHYAGISDHRTKVFRLLLAEQR